MTSPASRSFTRSGLLRLEALEGRVVPATLLPRSTLVLNLGTTVTGSSADDTITIDYNQARTHYQVSVATPGQITRVTSVPVTNIWSLTVNAGAGNDRIINRTPRATILNGEAGNDYIEGGSGNDTLDGGAGQDSLYGNAGNDTLTGGHGADSLYGGAGTDMLYGDLATSITALAGVVYNDYIDGGEGADTAFGGLGNDTLVGGSDSSADTLSGGVGDDWLFGRGGNDTLYGEAGNDNLYGEAGDDWMDGGAGNDNLYGHEGNDTLVGSEDADMLSGGTGNDTLDGRAGNDVLWGSTGNDVLFGDTGDDTLYGEWGNDILEGEDGNDTLYGGDDSDTLYGGNGADTLDGQSGSDSLFGEDGNDTLRGTEGNDLLDGGNGFDTMLEVRGRIVSGENIRLLVDGGYRQEDTFTCGPNSATRFLRHYGYDVNYAQMIELGRSETMVGTWPLRFSLYDIGIGTPPPAMRDMLRRFKSDVTLEQETSFDRVLSVLGQGKPVIALVKTGETRVLTEGIPTLHYYVLTGFNQSTQTLYYTNTNGLQYSMSYDDFQSSEEWDWRDGGLTGPILSAAGLKPRTILY